MAGHRLAFKDFQISFIEAQSSAMCMMLIPKTVTDGALVHQCTGALQCIGAPVHWCTRAEESFIFISHCQSIKNDHK